MCASGPGYHSRHSDLLRAGRFRDRIPVGARFSAPIRPYGSPSLLCNRYRGIPGGKKSGPWRSPPTPSSDEVKERVQLYPYPPPPHSEPSWSVLGSTLTFTFYMCA